MGGGAERVMELVWRSNQGACSYNVWTYNFSSVSTSLQAYSLLSETICWRCAHTSSTVVVSGDAFQIMTGCWRARTRSRQSHIITRPQTQTLFPCHTCTLISAHTLPGHTGTHPDTPVKLCQRRWKYGEHFQGAHRVLEEKSISNVPPTSLILKDEPSQQLRFVYQRVIRSLQLWISSHSMQPRPKGGGGGGIRHRLKEQCAKGGLRVGLRVNTIIVLLLRRQDSTSLSLW